MVNEDNLFEDSTIEDAKKVMQNMFNDITPEQFEELKKQAMENVKKNNMSAKELFEKIGGNYFENKNRLTIEFYDKYTDSYVYVEFWKDSKEFCFDINNFRKPELNLKLLLQAINKQVEELGWNE